jgi:hypothetical protein
VSDSRACIRPRILLALLVAALVIGTVPVRPRASRGEKASGTAAWRAASVRPVSPRPDLDPRGFPPLHADAPSLLPAVTVLRAADTDAPRAAAPSAPPARSPLPRAPPPA